MRKLEGFIWEKNLECSRSSLFICHLSLVICRWPFNCMPFMESAEWPMTNEQWQMSNEQ